MQGDSFSVYSFFREKHRVGALMFAAASVVLSLAVASVFAQTAPTNTVLLSNDDQADSTSAEQVILSHTYAQVFRTPPTGVPSLSKVVFETARTLNAGIHVWLLATDADGNPTGSPIAQKDISYTGSVGEREAIFDFPVPLTADTRYAIQFLNNTSDMNPNPSGTGNALKQVASSTLDEDSQPGWEFVKIVREGMGAWETWSGSELFKVQLIGVPAAGIALQEPDGTIAREKEIRAFVNISNTMDAGFPKYGEVTGSDCGSGTDTASFSSFTSGSRIRVTSESSNGKRYCFIASYDTGTITAALSGVIAGIDRTAPVISEPTLTGTMMTVSVTDANTHTDNAVTVRYKKISPTGTDRPCGSAQITGSADRYPSEGVLVHPTNDDGDYVCFRAEDTAGNVSYRASAFIGISFSMTIADDEDGSDLEQEKEITVTLPQTSGVTNTLWGLVDTADVCTPSSDSSLTTPYDASTSGTTVTINDQAGNGKFVCFKATFGGADYYQASGALAGIDSVAPRITIKDFSSTFVGSQGYINKVDGRNNVIISGTVTDENIAGQVISVTLIRISDDVSVTSTAPLTHVSEDTYRYAAYFSPARISRIADNTQIAGVTIRADATIDDLAGNTGENQTRNVIYDTHQPDALTNFDFLDAGDSCADIDADTVCDYGTRTDNITNSRTIPISMTLSDDNINNETFVTVKLFINNSERRFYINEELTPTTTSYTHTVTFESDAPDGIYKFIVPVYDAADNLSPTSAIMSLTLDTAPPDITTVRNRVIAVTEGTTHQYDPATATTVDGIQIADTGTGLVAHSVSHPVTAGLHEGTISATDLAGNTGTSPVTIAVFPQGFPSQTTTIYDQNGPVDVLNGQTATHTVFFDTENNISFFLPIPIQPSYTYNTGVNYDGTQDEQEITVTTTAINPATTLTVCFDNNNMPNRANDINVFVNGVKIENPIITEKGSQYCYRHRFGGGTITIGMGMKQEDNIRVGTGSSGGNSGGGDGTDLFFQDQGQTLIREITFGEQSPYVLEAQQVLNERTLCPVATEGIGSQGRETDYLGTQTQRALICSQQAMGLTVTGTLTPETYGVLMALSEQGTGQQANNQSFSPQIADQDPLVTNTTNAITFINPTNATTSTTSGRSSSVGGFEEDILTREILFGEQSPYVLEAQRILNEKTPCPVATGGVGSQGQETDYLGTLTQRALQCFQQVTGLTETGTLTPETYDVLRTLIGQSVNRLSFSSRLSNQRVPSASFTGSGRSPSVGGFEEEVLTREILFGEQSPYVLKAQQILNEQTSCLVAISGVGSREQETDYLGTLTQRALQCFQQAVGLTITGTLTPETYAALISLTVASRETVLISEVTFGEQSPYVLEAQQILNERTSCPVATEGAGSQGQETDYLGTLTQRALQCFQQAVGLTITGTLTPETYDALIALTR